MSATIHSVVMDERTRDLNDFVSEQVAERLNGLNKAMTEFVTQAIREAYVRGVRDGFQQGALAASPGEDSRARA